MKDKRIKQKIIQLKERCDIYIDYLSFFNESTYSDRLIETIIQIAQDIEKNYEKHFKKKVDTVKEK